MAGNPSRLGQVVAVSGAALLAVSVFLPWYSLTITPAGAAYAQGALNVAAARYGNAALQAEVNTVGSSFASVVGRQLATVSAHQVSKTIGILLLVLAAVAFIGALLWLAEIEEPIEVSGGQVATVGVLAALLVLYRDRMLDRPTGASVFSFSLSWGIWLALVGSVAIVGGAWVGRTGSRRPT